MNKSPDHLVALFQGADACERSWSVSNDAIEERALAFCETSVEAARRVANAAAVLGIEKILLSDWSKALPGADALGLALSRDRQSVRLYTQYWTALAARVEAGSDALFPLYRGFKSLPKDLVRQDDYLCVPMAPPEVFWPPMAQSLGAFGLDVEQGQVVLADLDGTTAIFTVTKGGGRRSWLTTVRRAHIDREAVGAWLSPMVRRPGGRELVSAAAQGDLVHIAGGEDTVKGPFVTFYIESDATTVLDWLA